MRTQCCVACCSLPALTVVVLVVAALTLLPQRDASDTPVAAQAVSVGLQLPVIDGRELARLQFADGLDRSVQPVTPPLVARVADDYGRFVLLAAAPVQEVARASAR